MTTDGWYWCLTHARVETAEDRDDPDNSLGPYPSAAEAADWQARVEARNARWQEADEEWFGTDEDGSAPT